MAWFYGLSFEQVENLTVDQFQEGWEAITVIEAQETLRNLIVETFPNLSKSGREKIHKKLHKQAYPSTFKESRVIRHEDLGKLLGGL